MTDSLGDVLQRTAKALRDAHERATQSQAEIEVEAAGAATQFKPPQDIVDLQERVKAIEERLARIGEPIEGELLSTGFAGSGTVVNVHCRCECDACV